MTHKSQIAVLMISLNEEHNMDAVCRNLKDWADEIFLIDSFSKDKTVEIALSHGVNVVQRKFAGFGDQWNYAVQNLPIRSSWTMKLDPDERLTSQLKDQLIAATQNTDCEGVSVVRRLWFMEKPLPVRQKLLRVWRTGLCKFTDVKVNEHPIVAGRIFQVDGELEHHDSPDLDHWYEKQNRYTTAEAMSVFQSMRFAAEPKLFGDSFERRMWLKKNFRRIPFRYKLYFLHQLFVVGSWRAGLTGVTWARLRSEVMRMIELKLIEMQRSKKLPSSRVYGPGSPDFRAKQAD
jgi:glycosyltransferase involved in cell wall biosynthesis